MKNKGINNKTYDKNKFYQSKNIINIWFRSQVEELRVLHFNHEPPQHIYHSA